MPTDPTFQRPFAQLKSCLPFNGMDSGTRPHTTMGVPSELSRVRLRSVEPDERNRIREHSAPATPTFKSAEVPASVVLN